jgi:hypothetical protein
VSGQEMAADADVLLRGWERIGPLARPWRELALLELLDPDTHPGVHARLPIGERDRHLLGVLVILAGRRVDCDVDCRACGERLSLELDPSALRADASAERGRTIRHAGRRIRVRPPDSHDIAACLGAADPEAALLDACTDAGPEPPAVLRDQLIQAMAELDPGAELLLAVTCPACGTGSDVPIDPGALAIAEVERQATLLLREVDQLARSYGWREADILALSAERRRAYVALTGP